MASYQSINFRREAILSGRPYPYYYPYVSQIPCISNSCEDHRIQADPNIIYSYEGTQAFDWSNGQCHDPTHNRSTCISNVYYPTNPIFDYCYYGETPFQDPSYQLGFIVREIVVNIIDVPDLRDPVEYMETMAPIGNSESLQINFVLNNQNKLSENNQSNPQINSQINPQMNPRINSQINTQRDNLQPEIYTNNDEPTLSAPVKSVLYKDPIDRIRKVTNCPQVTQDPGLIEPRNLIIVCDTIWVCTPGFLRAYNLLGVPTGRKIGTFGIGGNNVYPSSIAYNDNQCLFPIQKGSKCASSTMIIATLDGTINAYNPIINPENSILVIDNSSRQAMYTGVAICGCRVYLTDFYNQQIDVYDDKFILLPEFSFVGDDECDPIPEYFSPYNIVNICDQLYVTFVQQDPYNNTLEFDGTGLGYINIYTPDGIFIRRFASGCVLNVPYGLIEAPSCYGYPSGSILVANYGSGNINVFDIHGKWISNLKDGFGTDLYIEGLRGITYASCCPKTVYWTSCVNHKINKLGTINTSTNNC